MLAKAVDVHSVDPTKSLQPAKIIIVGRVMSNPRLLKLRNVGNFNDRFMLMFNAKWVIHISKPMGTMFEKDWDIGMSNLLALEQRVATAKGVNMLVHHEDGSMDVRMTAPCFVTKDGEDPDEALVSYISHVEPKFQVKLEELKPYWKLNVLRITNVKGEVIPPGMPQEKSMEGSLVEVMLTLKHNFISTSRVESFSAVLGSSRIMVSGIRYHKATEAYEAFMDGTLTATTSATEGSSSTSRDVELQKSGSEETISSSGTEIIVKSQDDCEDENNRKRKGRSGGTDRGNVKKAKLNG
ncbi:hypothetical protein IW262DRAFT_1452248 [Armillaria fumosa]|nr:hypothetical protein IW262DRAFT_1452248 [Armillaria fumosa]